MTAGNFVGQRILPVSRARRVRKTREQQAEHAELFVKRRVAQLGGAHLFPGAVQDLLHAVDALVFFIKLQVVGEIGCHAGELQVLPDHLAVDG